MTDTNTNGRTQRKSLASQLDRLDDIIDSLGEGLNGAVTDAVREAVRLAVQQAVEVVLREVLARPELLRQLSGQAQPIQAPQPEPTREPSRLASLCGKVKTKLASGWRWLREKVGGACQWIGRKVRELPGKVRSGLHNARVKLTSKVRGFFRGLREGAKKVWRLRRPVTMSVGIGLVVGGIGFLAGPVVSALALGLCGSAISLTGFVLAPFIRLWRTLNAQTT